MAYLYEKVDCNYLFLSVFLFYSVKAAYRNNTVGLPKLCPEESIDKIDRAMLYTYMNSYHTPERTVLTGVGIDHEELVKLAETMFMNKTPIWKEHENILDLSREKDLSISQYTGGYFPVSKLYRINYKIYV